MEKVLDILHDEHAEDSVSAGDSTSDDDDGDLLFGSDNDYMRPLERYNSIHYLLERHLKERFIYTSI